MNHNTKKIKNDFDLIYQFKWMSALSSSSSVQTSNKLNVEQQQIQSTTSHPNVFTFVQSSPKQINADECAWRSGMD